MIIHKWISSDGSELVPTTDIKINLTLPSLAVNCFSDPFDDIIVVYDQTRIVERAPGKPKVEDSNP
jgi:hypothetical protein